ncbi:3858_t:CDS:2 [Diversispora eburnea]|uniref:3858_t:CDS:1 n=1 Tax=Diversispora eburnea TaxID=1213867 RepID=A0A9N9AXZ8_9GLOM|nr:3858_t:CDS:2 [Diversispora eburnea]
MLFSITLTALAGAVVISASVILLISEKHFKIKKQENQKTSENMDQYVEANNEQIDSHSQHQIFQQNKNFVSSPFTIKEKQQKRHSVISKQHARLESIIEETDNEIDNEESNNGNVAHRLINSPLVPKGRQKKLDKISKRYTSLESIMEEADEE